MKKIVPITMTWLIATFTGAYGLDVGDKAPLFTAESTAGTLGLAGYLGNKHVVLAFYYADFTPV